MRVLAVGGVGMVKGLRLGMLGGWEDFYNNHKMSLIQIVFLNSIKEVIFIFKEHIFVEKIFSHEIIQSNMKNKKIFYNIYFPSDQTHPKVFGY